MAIAYLSLGCNIGNCRANLAAALAKLDSHPDVSVTAVSSVYITEPVGDIEQPSFLNIAASLETEMPAAQLLEYCRGIEHELGGRDNRRPMGPRSIDLDILLYERLEIAEGNLTIPHPGLFERAFVLVPLNEIAAGVELPGGGTVADAFRAGSDEHGVEIDKSEPFLNWRREQS